MRETGTDLRAAGRAALARGELTRARELFARALARPEPAGDPDRLLAMAELADVLAATGDRPGAARLLDALQTEALAAGHDRLAAHGRLAEAVLHADDWGPGHLVRTAEQVLPLFEATGDTLGLARCWARLGTVSRDQGRFGATARRYEQALRHAGGDTGPEAAPARRTGSARPGPSA